MKFFFIYTEKPFKLCVNNSLNIYVGEFFSIIGKLYDLYV